MQAATEGCHPGADRHTSLTCGGIQEFAVVEDDSLETPPAEYRERREDIVERLLPVTPFNSGRPKPSATLSHYAAHRHAKKLHKDHETRKCLHQPHGVQSLNTSSPRNRTPDLLFSISATPHRETSTACQVRHVNLCAAVSQTHWLDRPYFRNFVPPSSCRFLLPPRRFVVFYQDDDLVDTFLRIRERVDITVAVDFSHTSELHVAFCPKIDLFFRGGARRREGGVVRSKMSKTRWPSAGDAFTLV